MSSSTGISTKSSSTGISTKSGGTGSTFKLGSNAGTSKIGKTGGLSSSLGKGGLSSSLGKGGLGGKSAAEAFLPKGSKLATFFADLSEIDRCPSDDETDEEYHPNPNIYKKSNASYVKDIEFDGVNFDQVFVFKDTQ